MFGTVIRVYIYHEGGFFNQTYLIMKLNLIKSLLLVAVLGICSSLFAQTPGSSPGSPSAPGSSNVNPTQSNPGISNDPGIAIPLRKKESTATGSTGPSGFTGPTATSGFTGPSGYTGNTGSIGPKGNSSTGTKDGIPKK